MIYFYFRLLTNKVMSSMNMKGNKGKTAFSKTKAYEVVVGEFVIFLAL